MDDKDKKNITNKENITEGNLETTSKQSEITNDDGSITYISQITEKKTGTGIISDPQKVEEISLGVSAEDTKYVDAIRAKKELGVLFNDKLLTYITVNAFENILKLMDENLENYFDALSFGIYSYQEILELKKSIKTIEIEKKENIIKYFEVYSEENKNKLNHFTNLNDDIFKSVDKQFEFIKEEEERKKREEEERLRRLKEAEEEKKRWKELRRKKIKNLFEENMNSYETFEIMKRRFHQYKEGIEVAKRKQKEVEEQKRLLRLKKQKEEEQKKKEEEEEKVKKEEEEKIRKEEEERKRKEEEEKKRKEEEDKKRLEEEENKRKIEEEKLKREEEEKRQKEELERLKKEEELKRQKEEEERFKREEDERIKKEKEEKIKREQEEKEIKIKEEEERKRKELEEIEKRKKEEELKKIKEEENKIERKQELNNINETNYILTLNNHIKYKKNKIDKKIKEENNKNQKKEENIKIQKIDDKNEIKKEKQISILENEKEDEKKLSMNKAKQKNSIFSDNETKIPKKKSYKIKPQMNQVKKLEQKKVSKKPLKKKSSKKIIPLETNKENKIKNTESKIILTEFPQTFSPSNKNANLKLKKKSIPINIMYDDKQIQFKLRYYKDFQTDNDLFEEKRRNKSAERRHIKKIINIDNEQYIKIICNECGEKNYFGNYCENCQGPICSKCKELHLLENSNHKYNILKNKNYISNKVKEICTKCEKNLENKFASKCLNCPKELFCNECSLNHNLIYPTHVIIPKEKENNKNIDDDSEESLENNNNKNISDIIKCFICENKIPFRDNNYITHCNKCKGNLCNKCENIHLKKKPLHKFISLNTMIINDTSNIENYYQCSKCSKDLNNNLYLYNCPQCHGNLCYNCGNEHFKENLKHKICILKSKIQELVSNDLTCFNCGIESSVRCEKCKVSFCDKCKENHIQKNPYHKLIILQNNNINKISEEAKNKDFIICVFCRKIIKSNDKIGLNFCQNCDGCLCKTCIIRHKDYYPFHKIINEKSMKIIKEKKISNNKEIQIKYCYQCKRNLKSNIQYCFRCNEYYCEKCGKSHSFNFPKHKIRNEKYKFDNEINKKLQEQQFNEKNEILSNNNSKEEYFNYITSNNENLKNKLDANQKFKSPDKIEENSKNNCKKRKEDRVSLNEKINNYDKCKMCGAKNLGFQKKCSHCNLFFCNNCFDHHMNVFPCSNKLKMNVRLHENKDKSKDKTTASSNQYNCAICRKSINLINNEIFMFCRKCGGNICEKCKNTHILKYPKHNQIFSKIVFIDTNSNQFINNELKCLVCKMDLSNKINEPISSCSKCKGNLCNNCSRSHESEFIRHRLEYKLYISNIINKENKEPNLNKSKENDFIEQCFSCNKNLFIQESSMINHCFNCKVNFCIKCSKNHFKNNNSHDLSLFEVKLNKYTEGNDKSYSICEICGDSLNIDKAFYRCENCEIDFCQKCLYIHYRSKPNHNYILIKYIQTQEKEENKNKINNDIVCDICSNNLKKENSIFCENCQYAMCEKCANNFHKRKYPQHYLISNQKFKHEKMENEENEENDFDLTTHIKKKNSCITCRIRLDDFARNSCNYCNKIFCNECIKQHYDQNYDHRLIKSSSQKNIFSKNIFSLKEEQNENNDIEKCNKCLKACINCPIYKCNQCKIKLCEECISFHNKMFSSHKISLFKDNSNQNEAIKETKNKITCLCIFCKKSHVDFPKRFFYVCSECNGNICSICKKNHDNKFYSHILVFPHKYGEETDINKRHRRYASIG